MIYRTSPCGTVGGRLRLWPDEVPVRSARQMEPGSLEPQLQIEPNTTRRNDGWRRSDRAAAPCQLKSAVCFSNGTIPSTRASSMTRSMVRSFNRLAMARNASPARISGQSRARQRRSYSRSRAPVEAVVAQGAGQHLRRDPAAEQAEIDPAARRRLHESCGIADGQHATRPRPRDRRKRKNLDARLGPSASDAEPAIDAGARVL